MQMFKKFPVLIFLLIVFLVAGCSNSDQLNGPTANPEISPSATITSSPVVPTPTSLPMALIVNNEGISLQEYQINLNQINSAQTELGKNLSAEELSQKVLDYLTDETLLEQAAYEAGFELTEAAFNERLDTLVAEAGGEEAFQAWLSNQGYSESIFLIALRRSVAASWQRDQIIAQVPNTAEQVHARQIMVSDQDTADKIYNRLQSGADFATIAFQYDPLTGGELSWFPRGYLILSEIEDAVFELQPGQYTPVLSTAYGFQIVQVIERDANRSLTPDAYSVMQHKALENWLSERRKASSIEILIPK